MSRHPSEPPADWLPSSEEDGTADYPPPGYPQDRYPPAGYPAMPDYPHTPGYPAAGYPPPAPDGPSIAHDEYRPSGDPYARLQEEYSPPPEAYTQQQQAYDAPRDPYGQPPDGYAPGKGDYDQTGDPPGGYDHPPAQPDVEPWPDGPDAADARWTMLGYLTVPLFGPLVPLAVYLRNLRGSNWTRAHAAQALNLWITVMLYNISAVIMGTMLALDSPRVALIVFAPLILALWLIALTVLVRAATAASEGRRYGLPRWLCSPLLR